ncbi:MAG: winged helix-turn-helix domain-containing protein [Actinomycetia bacterium]|nr:winged helix-turn-helix domain-containing protein [Actinomycetes bacterium]MCH9762108.1 winged helix-turn-helix domain-containing protein [Actinomycetes bacterium]
MELDPDDPRPPYKQVESSLRAAILTRIYTPGEKLPSGQELATRYGVARMTVLQALRGLREEGLVVSRVGSGVYVRERIEKPVGLRPHVERAFELEHVTIDFFGFTGETLHAALQEPLDKVRAGRLTPRSVTIRCLVPDSTKPWALPCDADSGEDVKAFRTRHAQISGRHLDTIRNDVKELQGLGLLDEATCAVRVHLNTPLFKLYLLNEREVFFGFYPPEPHAVRIDGKDYKMLDLMGKDTVLFHHEANDDAEAVGTQYVRESSRWFNAMWDRVAAAPSDER